MTDDDNDYIWGQHSAFRRFPEIDIRLQVRVQELEKQEEELRKAIKRLYQERDEAERESEMRGRELEKADTAFDRLEDERDQLRECAQRAEAIIGKIREEIRELYDKEKLLGKDPLTGV